MGLSSLFELFVLRRKNLARKKKDLSRDMRFPTMWHFDMNTLGWACVLLQWQCSLILNLETPNAVQSVAYQSAVIEYSREEQRLWSDCTHAQAGLSLCWLHIPYCWKSHILAKFLFGHNLTLFKIIQNGCHPFSPMQGDMSSAMMAFSSSIMVHIAPCFQ